LKPKLRPGHQQKKKKYEPQVVLRTLLHPSPPYPSTPPTACLPFSAPHPCRWHSGNLSQLSLKSGVGSSEPEPHLSTDFFSLLCVNRVTYISAYRPTHSMDPQSVFKNDEKYRNQNVTSDCCYCCCCVVFMRKGLTIQSTLALNSRSSCLTLPCTGNTGVCHQALFIFFFVFLNCVSYS
jgi:hypothetical protein